MRSSASKWRDYIFFGVRCEKAMRRKEFQSLTASLSGWESDDGWPLFDTPPTDLNLGSSSPCWSMKSRGVPTSGRWCSLLKSWREDYRQPAGHHISGYTLLHGDQLRNTLSGKLNPGPRPPRAICASNSAAQWFAPYVRVGTHSFYTDEPGAQMLKETLRLTHAAQGANVILRIPNDESLFEDAVQPAPGIFCANPVVTYLDLWNGNDRDREAADHMAAKCFPWL